MRLQHIAGIILLSLLLVGCVGLNSALQHDAKHIEVTNAGFVLPLSPDPAGAAIVLGTQRISVDSVPVYTIAREGEDVIQFQSLYEEYENGVLTRKVIDTISFCNDTSLSAGTPGTGGDSSTIASTASGNAATDKCQQSPAE